MNQLPIDATKALYIFQCPVAHSQAFMWVLEEVFHCDLIGLWLLHMKHRSFMIAEADNKILSAAGGRVTAWGALQGDSLARHICA